MRDFIEHFRKIKIDSDYGTNRVSAIGNPKKKSSWKEEHERDLGNPHGGEWRGLLADIR